MSSEKSYVELTGEFTLTGYKIVHVVMDGSSCGAALELEKFIGHPVRQNLLSPEQQAAGLSSSLDIPFLDYEFVRNGYYVAKHATGIFAVLTPGEYHNLRVKAYRQKSYAHDCVYISGPMTGYANANIPAFIKSELAHLALGHQVYSPAHNQKDSGMTWEDYMRLAIPQLMQCNTIHMLRKWEKSRGALIEHNLACAVGMDVTYE